MDARELSAKLPPPRDDEPPSLRQDILDELADHLRCALRRELLATGDEEAARRRVIESFGDPAEIARKLWFQAMWRRIMSQRLMASAVGLLTVVCLALAGLTGWLIQQQRVAAAQQQQVFAQMIERMARLAESKGLSEGTSASPATTASSIQAKLTLGTPDGPPATDYRVTLIQLGFDKEKSISEKSDSAGTADLGYPDPGRYVITIQTPWNFTGPVKRFVLHPSTAHVEHVVCPPTPEQVPVSFVASLPEDLLRLGLQTTVQLDPGVWEYAGQVWKDSAKTQDIFVQRDGCEIVQLQSNGPIQTRTADGQWWRWTDSGYPARPTKPHILAGPRYTVRSLRLVLPVTAGPSPEGSRGGGTSSLERLYEQIAPKPPAGPPGWQQLGMRQEVPMTFPLKLEFVAEAGKLNEWVIPIPDELIQQAREYLKEHPPASANDE